ncbi:MAG: C69 family dipeptidase [Bacteroides sp.]|jgi:dipeptidase|nr:C69 family dipeptidase [Bacteroides sp.]
MKKVEKLALLLLCLVACSPEVWACTNLLVGKKASVDGSAFISYSCDGYGFAGSLPYTPPANYGPGALFTSGWGGQRPYCDIPQSAHTYGVIGNINEHQVAIGETTFEGRPELEDTVKRGIDYATLMMLALQRSRTAREAIHVMTSLVEEYGYHSTGESFSIADPNEIWILEMIGKGSEEKGAVWVARRIPDDCIAAHANQSRIHKFPLHDKDNCLYSADVISFARKKGYFSGKDKDFDFADAYNPLNFSGRRFCEARVWSFFRTYCAEMEKYISYIKGTTDEPMPLFVKPDRKLSVRDVQHMMRDHYEGTELDPTKDVSAGPFHSPYRMSALVYTVDGKKMFNERPIGTQQSAYTFVAQVRSNLPDGIGGILWFGLDDSNMTVFTPVYCCANQVPECYSSKYATSDKFSWKSAFWIYNWVAGMIRPYYSLMIGDLRTVQNGLEDQFANNQDSIESVALKLYTDYPDKAKAMLTAYTIKTAEETFHAWKTLGEDLIVKYNDCGARDSKTGHIKRIPASEDYSREVLKATKDRYVVP